MTRRILRSAALAAALWSGATAAGASEIRVGAPVVTDGMEIAAVYLQPVLMSPAEPMAGRPDIHLEADIHAVTGNVHGFEAGAWIPYLQIAYRIRKEGADFERVGSFMPMVAADGPHYGANVALDGPGTYRLDYEIVAPVRNGLYRHIDTETGVADWWAPIHVGWSFKYLGTGKKGGY